MVFVQNPCFQGVASTLMMALMLLLFLKFWQKDLVTVGDFTFVMSSAFSIMMFTWWIAEQLVFFFKELGVAKQALKVMQIPHEIVDNEGALPLEIAKGELSFQNVTFN
jgi:ATP-binding cassette subfamily B protein